MMKILRSWLLFRVGPMILLKIGHQHRCSRSAMKNDKISEKAIKRHIASIRHKRATENYSVELFGRMEITKFRPNFTFKTESDT